MNFKLFSPYSRLFVLVSQKNDGSMRIISKKDIWAKNLSNRTLFLRKNRINPDFLVSAELVHGNKIKIATQRDKGEIVSAVDGLFTREKDLFLSATVADCLPIFLFEPKKEIIGMIHAGWRSLEKDILSNAVRKIKNLAGKPEYILVGVGPAICQKYYEVGPEVAEKFEKYPEVIKKEKNKLFLDIKKVAELQLLDLGLLEKNIEISPDCTYELPKKYFSARRDRPKEVEAMIAVIGIRK